MRTLQAFGLSAAALSVIVAASVAAAADLAPSDILANPATYDGKPVSVTGTVAKFQTNKTLMGTVTAYQLCDAKCVVVIDQTAGVHQDSDKVTAAGTFERSFKGPKRSFNNVVLIK